MNYELILCNAMSNARICKVEMLPETLVSEISEQARAALIKRAKGDEGAVFDVVLVSGGSTVDGERTCRQAGFPFGGTAYCTVMSAAAAAVARARAKHQRILRDLDALVDSVEAGIPAEPFGTELAMLVEAGLRAQRSARGRMRLSWQSGLVNSSEEDIWSLDLCRSQVIYRRSTEIFTSDLSRTVETGGIEFRIGDRSSNTVVTFNTSEEFIEFWETMSEKRIAAYCVGLKTTGPCRARIQNTLKRSDLEDIARCPDEAVDAHL